MHIDHRPGFDSSSPPAWGRLAGWLILTVGTGFALGMAFPADSWYESLNHPFFRPPNWLFAPVWTTLYVLMAIAIWRIERTPGPQASGARLLFIVQLALNFTWSPSFFGLHSIGLALAVIVLMWFAIMATTIAFARVDRVAALLMAPYIAWVSFALALNIAYVVLN